MVFYLNYRSFSTISVSGYPASQKGLLFAFCIVSCSLRVLHWRSSQHALALCVMGVCFEFSGWFGLFWYYFWLVSLTLLLLLISLLVLLRLFIRFPRLLDFPPLILSSLLFRLYLLAYLRLSPARYFAPSCASAHFSDGSPLYFHPSFSRFAPWWSCMFLFLRFCFFFFLFFSLLSPTCSA